MGHKSAGIAARLPEERDVRRILIALSFLWVLSLAVDAQGLPQRMQLAGRNVLIWRPALGAKGGLVLFPHGYRGINSQSGFLMRALARAGYLVVAPNHRDYMMGHSEPQMAFDDAADWTDQTYRDRAEDLTEVYQALLKHAELKGQFDPERLVLMGHSLGGYTVLGLAGAWSSWASFGLKPKAIVAFSPYCRPYVIKQTLPKLTAPVMYQGGTRDSYITPTVSRAGGAYDQSPEPKVFVEFAGAGHQAWTPLEDGPRELIEKYTLAFLEHCLEKKPPAALLSKPLKGVSQLRFSRDLESGPALLPHSAPR